MSADLLLTAAIAGYGAYQNRQAEKDAKRAAERAQRRAEHEQAQRDIQVARINALFGQPGALEELRAAQQRAINAGGPNPAELTDALNLDENGRVTSASGVRSPEDARRIWDAYRARGATAFEAEVGSVVREVEDARRQLERAVVDGANRTALDMFSDDARTARQLAARGVGTASTGVDARREALERLQGNKLQARQTGQQAVFNLNQQLEGQRQRLIESIRSGQNVRFNSQDILGQQRAALDQSMASLGSQSLGQAANAGAVTVSGLTQDANSRANEQAQLFGVLSSDRTRRGRIS